MSLEPGYRGRRRRRLLSIGVFVLVVAVVAAVALSGCSTDPLSAQARAGDDKNYVAGNGSVTELAPDQRGEPVQVAGTSAAGEPIDLAELRGEVVVLNLWYAACGPCRAEAADLAEIATGTAVDGVRFVGINTRDEPETAQAFERTFEVPYPSIIDNQGAVVLALRGEVSPQSVPTTLVVDRQGRVAARILGPVNPSTLRTLVDSAVAEAA